MHGQVFGKNYVYQKLHKVTQKQQCKENKEWELIITISNVLENEFEVKSFIPIRYKHASQCKNSGLLFKLYWQVLMKLSFNE